MTDMQGGALLSPMGNAALTMAARGYMVFPLKPYSKIPLLPSVHLGDTAEAKAAKKACQPPTCGQLGHGVWDATIDPSLITEWWTAEPNANIAIATGLSNLLVVDVDTKDGKRGAQTLADLEREHGPLPRTLTIRTWSGGLHYYFRMPARRMRNTTGTDRAGLGPDIDTRGDAGYVVAPPSIIRDGGREGRYEVIRDV